MLKLYNTGPNNSKNNNSHPYNGIIWNFHWFLPFISLYLITTAKDSAGNCYNAVLSKNTKQRNFDSSRRPLVGIAPWNPKRSGSSRTSRDSIKVSDEERYILPKQPLSGLSSHRTIEPVELVSVSTTKSRMARNLFRGALLRIASDLTGGTPLESIKARVAITTEGPWEATKNIISDGGGIQALWTGSSTRTIEGALQGAMFVAGSTATKRMILANGGSTTLAALCGGCVGGIAQALIMTPAGVIFTTLNVNQGKKGYLTSNSKRNNNALAVTKAIWNERGIRGLYTGIVPMVIRQSTNWASRAGLTEVARTQFHLSNYGVWGEIGSGILGGVGSCWNTPVETVRLWMQRDVVATSTNTMGSQRSARFYIDQILERDGVGGLFRGVTPRAIQAIWQTTFMVVVPNLLGV